MMDILNYLKCMETTFFTDMSDLFTDQIKTELVYKNVIYLFYEPSIESINRYLLNAGIIHDDLIVLGKVIINGKKMLFVYMDLCYYGITKSGIVFLLGNTIDRLSIGKRKVFINPIDDTD